MDPKSPKTNHNLIYLEIIIGFFTLMTIGYLLLQNSDYSVNLRREVKDIQIPSPSSISGNYDVITKENPNNKLLTDIYLKDKKTGKESLFKTLLDTEYALNPEKNFLAFSDYPAIFEEGTRKEYVRSGKKVNLIIYDFKNKTSKVIVTSTMNMFRPEWEDPETLTYTNQGSRISYDILRRGLSYIVIYTAPNIGLVLRNASGKEIAESFVESIGDPTGESKHVISSREIYYSKPETGVYFAEFSSTNSSAVSYKAEILLYDREAEVLVASHSGVLKNNKEVVKINYNQLDSRLSSIQK